MSTSISTTGSISSTGIGSGLDVASIISSLMAVESQPLHQMQSAAASIQTKVSAFGTLQSAMSSFRDAALALTNSSTWSATTASSADTSAITVSTGATAPAGNYSIEVKNLATSQSVASGAFASTSATVGAGSVHIDLGTWSADQSGFTPKAGTPGLDITIAATDTLANVRDKINSAGAGVSASIVTDASGSRMVLSSSTTGADNGFRISASDSDGVNTDAAGVSALAYDPAGGTTGTSLTQSAANANATINGLAISSATNSLANVVDGITLNLVKVTTGPVQVSVGQDNTSIKAAIKNFTSAYNSLSNLLGSDTKYDAGSGVAGVLQGDSTAVSLQRQLRNILGASSTASSAFATLSDAGLEIQKDGTVNINDTKLSSALGNLGELKKLFANTDLTGATQDGFAQSMRSFGDSVLGSDGMLTTRTAGLNTSLTSNTKRQDEENTRLAATQARLQAQYSALDTQIASLTALNTYVTQQLTNWNKPAA